MTPTGQVVGGDYPGDKVKVADSRKEYARRLQLIAEQEAGLIHLLEFQKVYWLHINGVRVCKFIADSFCVRAGRPVVEDVKPMRKVKKNGQYLKNPDGSFVLKAFTTPVYKLKKRMMKAEYGIEIQEF